MITIDLDPLMTNMTVFRSSVTYFAVKMTEIKDILTFRYQLELTHGFGDCGYNYIKVLWKTIENIPFSQKNKKER